MNKFLDYVKRYQIGVVIIIALVVYALTLAPSVVQIDAGELATVQALPGVAHPTGYPVFTLLGFLFSKIFSFFPRMILSLNFLAAFYVTLAVAFFYKIVLLMLENIEPNETARKFYSALAALFIGFSATYWTQSASVEVYSLHLALTSIVIWRLLIAFRTNTTRDWLWFSVALAVSFGNHMTTVMLLPAVAYLYFYKNRFNTKSFLRIALMLALFFPLLIAEYSFLVFLAKTEPKLNWGDVENLQNLLRHLSGKQYQVWMFSGAEVAQKQFAYFLSRLPKEFAYAGLLPIALGFFAMKKESGVYAVFSAILFVSVVAYAINYNIHDIDAYFLLAYVSLGFFALFGFRVIADFIDEKFNKRISPVILAGFVALEILVSFPAVSEANNFVFEDYTKSALNSVEKNAVVLTYQWDYFVSPSYYFRYIENYRSDVAVVDKELLRRSWYYKQLSNNYPFVLKGTEKVVKNFLEALKPFEAGERFNSALLEKLYRAIISGIIANNIKERAVYIAPELIDNELKRGEFTLPRGYFLAPCDFFFKVVPADKYYDCPVKPINIRFDGAPENQYVEKVKQLVKTMLVRRGLYEMQFGRNDKAKKIVQIYRKLFPDSALPNLFSKLFE